MKRRRRRGERGVALLLVLWVFMLLGVIALDFSEYMRDDAMSALNLADGTRGYYVALAGMNRGMLDWVRNRERIADIAAGTVEPDEQEEGPLVSSDGSWHEGDFQGIGTGGPGYEFEIEPPTGGLTYEPYSVSMANDTRTNGSQFFIALADLSAGLPPSYTIFGQVTSGTDVIDEIAAVPVNDPQIGVPLTPVTIASITISAGGE